MQIQNLCIENHVNCEFLVLTLDMKVLLGLTTLLHKLLYYSKETEAMTLTNN